MDAHIGRLGIHVGPPPGDGLVMPQRVQRHVLLGDDDGAGGRGAEGVGGEIQRVEVRAAVEAQVFAGYSEIEIFSNDWWSRPIDEVLQTCIARHRTVV